MIELPKFVSGLGYSYKHDVRTAGGSRSGSTSTSSYRSSGYYGNSGTAGNAGSAGSSRSGGWPEDRGSFNQNDDDKWVGVSDPEGFIKDYDEEFREIWEQYAAQHEETV